ncbi:MAG: hypothetical protein A3K83_06865 [Omnitrophica WOR_2 bacterium RBG_13_44_8b]|nr:MAG: hypothetical protein A3K83_06865 [Omnitrophica WOR_2 bacterium RBG_13_44_8b]
MDKKTIAIAVLGVALLICIGGIISTSSQIRKVAAEKSEIIEKIKETDNLTTELSKNVSDLKALLGKVEKDKDTAEKEKQRLYQETEEMKKRLEQVSMEKAEEKQEANQ